MRNVRPRTVIFSLSALSMLVYLPSAQHSQAATINSNALTGYVMRVQLSPAVCLVDKTKQKQRQCLEGYALTIAGLIPETVTARDCTTNSNAKLSTIQAQVIARIMPNEAARQQLWHSVGGCVPMSASQYFRSIITYAEKLKIPAELSDGASHMSNASMLKQHFNKLNPNLKPQSLRLSCQNDGLKTLLTDIQVCYSPNGQFKACSAALSTNCPAEFTIQGSY